MDATHDPEAGAWYFSTNPDDETVIRTFELAGTHRVLIDVDRFGRIVGVEVLGRPS